MGTCAGIDGASAKRDVLIAGDDGHVLLGETFAHDENGITALCDAVACFVVQVVAIERPDGVLVERLLEAGMPSLSGSGPARSGCSPRSTARSRSRR